MEKRLYRNVHDRAIAGVASGVADYLGLDKTIVRLLFVLATLFLAGAGAIAYIVLWIVSPINNDLTKKYQEFNTYFNQQPQGGSVFNNPESLAGQAHTSSNKWNTPNNWQQQSGEVFKETSNIFRTVFGTLLILLGIYFLLYQYDWIPDWFSFYKIYKFWPLAIVAVGLGLIFKKRNHDEWEKFKKEQESTKEEQTETNTEEKTVDNQD